MAKIIIVNENDEMIGLKERAELLPEDIYRVATLWITNSKGNILLAQRSKQKKHDPGKWGPAVAGTVEENETYESNIVKEAEEEIGLSGIDFQVGPKIRKSGDHNFFSQRFMVCVDREISEFKIQKDEVGQIKWFRREDLLKDIEENPDNYLKNANSWTDRFEG